MLLAAGIGITPLLAMLRHIVHEGRRTRSLRPTWLFQAARTRSNGPDTEIAELVKAGNAEVHWVRTLSQPGTAKAGRDYDHEGHIDMTLLKATLPWDDYDFYLCGPDAFMQATYDGLRERNVPDERIHAEAFGPSALKRSMAGAAPPPNCRHPPHSLSASSLPARPGSALEARRRQPARSGRGARPGARLRLPRGSCGDCRTRVLQGWVTYASPPSFAVPAGEALICCAVPAQGMGRLCIWGCEEPSLSGS